MDSIFMCLVLALVMGLAAVFVLMWKRGSIGRKGADYRAIMNLGIIFIAVGLFEFIAYGELSVLLSLGLIYFAIGFAYRNRPVKPLTKEQKRLKLILVSLLLIAVIATVAVFAFF